MVYCFDAPMIDFCQICYNGAFSLCDGFGSSSGLADKFHWNLAITEIARFRQTRVMEQILSSEPFKNRIKLIRRIFDRNARDFEASKMQFSAGLCASAANTKFDSHWYSIQCQLSFFCSTSINRSMTKTFEFIVRFFFLFICHNLRKGLLAAQTILTSMPLSIPYLPCSQSISVDFKGTISRKFPISSFFVCKKNIFLMPSFVLIHLL